MTTKQSKLDRIPLLLTNPDAATRDDVAFMAGEIMEYRRALVRAEQIMKRDRYGRETYQFINDALDD